MLTGINLNKVSLNVYGRFRNIFLFVCAYLYYTTYEIAYVAPFFVIWVYFQNEREAIVHRAGYFELVDFYVTLSTVTYYRRG